eukprot:jgi/Phyca11/21961/fgenesh1_pg.PHYCAscaffold_277_\
METYAPATHANAMHSVATTEERGPKRVAPGKPKPVKEQVKKQREANREATATTAKERRRQTRDINRAGLTQTSEVEESNSNNEQGHSTAHSSAEDEADSDWKATREWRWPLEHLVTWGKAEEFNEQTAALARPMDDSHQPEEATALCREWMTIGV